MVGTLQTSTCILRINTLAFVVLGTTHTAELVDIRLNIAVEPRCVVLAVLKRLLSN